MLDEKNLKRKEAQARAHRNWRINNPEKYKAALEKTRQWRKQNPDKTRRQRKQWKLNNPEKFKAMRKRQLERYRKKHPYKQRTIEQKAKAAAVMRKLRSNPEFRKHEAQLRRLRAAKKKLEKQTVNRTEHFKIETPTLKASFPPNDFGNFEKEC